jgi:CDP-diacylglycerol--glycerol-3-phosphate 3-phosphatidyltransferase
MASIYGLKPKFQALLRPIVRALARSGVTANQVTVAAVALSLAVGAAIFLVGDRRILLLLPLALVMRMALNAIDGMLAREHGQASKLGALLNEAGDVASDALMYLPLMARPEFPSVVVLMLVVFGFLIETVGMAAVQFGASRRYDGPFGKSDRAFAFGALALLLGLGVPGGVWLRLMFVVMAGLAVATLIQRTIRALKEAAPSEPYS